MMGLFDNRRAGSEEVERAEKQKEEADEEIEKADKAVEKLKGHQKQNHYATMIHNAIRGRLA